MFHSKFCSQYFFPLILETGPMNEKISLVKEFIENGRIQEFKDITTFIPKTTLAHQLGTNNDRITRLINSPEEFTIKELLTIADFLDVNHSSTIRITCKQYYKTLEEPNKRADV